jgi:ADP-ribosylglycohydrolase
MRISPLGVWAYLKNLPLEEFYESVRWEGYITHRNELAIGGAFAVAYAVYLNLKEKPPKGETVKAVLRVMEDLGMENPVKGAIERALELKEVEGSGALQRLGTGGYIVDTVGSAFYLFLSQRDFIKGLSLLWEVGGDTDTIGAIFGSLYGSLYGLKNIPKDLIERLEVREKIEKLTEVLISSHP